MAFFWSNYLGNVDPRQSYAAPSLVDHVSGLAPALVIAAEFDILREENEHYAAKLRRAGCSVVQVTAPGMIHGFFWQFGAVPSARDCLLSISEFITDHLV
jgi:acetyl esterase